MHRLWTRLRAWLDEAHANLVVVNGARVACAPDFLIEVDGRPSVIEWSKLILATGASEQLLPFEGWTLPSVAGAGGLQTLIKGGMPVQRIVVAGSGPLLLAVADTARRHGADVRAVIEQASFARVARFVASLALTPPKLAQALMLATSRYHTGCVVVKAHDTDRVEAVTIRSGTTERVASRADTASCRTRRWR